MEVDDDLKVLNQLQKHQKKWFLQSKHHNEKVDAATELLQDLKKSPMEMTIEETLKLRADERRKKLKEFNYKFHNNVSKIDEYEETCL
jgi:cell division protein FtsZ